MTASPALSEDDRYAAALARLGAAPATLRRFLDGYRPPRRGRRWRREPIAPIPAGATATTSAPRFPSWWHGRAARPACA